MYVCVCVYICVYNICILLSFFQVSWNFGCYHSIILGILGCYLFKYFFCLLLPSFGTLVHTAILLIRLFHSTFFPYNVERKKFSLPAGVTDCVKFALSSNVCVGFRRVSSFLPHPKDVHVKWIGCLHCPPVWVSMGYG